MVWMGKEEVGLFVLVWPRPVQLDLVWFGLLFGVWFVEVLVCLGLAWFGLVRFGSVCFEAWFAEVCRFWSGPVPSGLVWDGLVCFGVVWCGVVWFGLDRCFCGVLRFGLT